MARAKLISVKHSGGYLNSDSDTEPYLCTYEEEYTYWFFWKRTRIRKITYQVSDFNTSWLPSMEKKIGVWREVTKSR